MCKEEKIISITSEKADGLWAVFLDDDKKQYKSKVYFVLTCLMDDNSVVFRYITNTELADGYSLSLEQLGSDSSNFMGIINDCKENWIEIEEAEYLKHKM